MYLNTQTLIPAINPSISTFKSSEKDHFLLLNLVVPFITSFFIFFWFLNISFDYWNPSPAPNFFSLCLQKKLAL